MRAHAVDDLFRARGQQVATVPPRLRDDDPHDGHSTDETDEHAEDESEHGTRVTHEPRRADSGTRASRAL